jgi:hypothetical protein
MLDLDELVKWIEYELNLGNRVKASKLYKVFYKYAKIHHPNISEYKLRNFNNYYWNNY